jgi:dTDP-4-dehydrorhamnose 3,5-epimerase
MFEKIETNIQGCFVLKPKVFKDERGTFIKLFNKDLFADSGLENVFEETYYSTSQKGVLRGLHHQEPPVAHAKCITCLEGALFDVVVDIRKNSPTYKQHFSITLNKEEITMLYIPEGLSHGFMALTDDCLFLNKTTKGYCPECDAGIKWDTCGIKWPMENPIVSAKDQALPSLADYNSPF